MKTRNHFFKITQLVLPQSSWAIVPAYIQPKLEIDDDQQRYWDDMLIKFHEEWEVFRVGEDLQSNFFIFIQLVLLQLGWAIVPAWI